MKSLFKKITNGRYTEPLVKNKKYEILFQKGVNIDQYYIYRKDETHILTVNVYPHEKVEIITLIPWESPEVDKVTDICKELFKDLKIFGQVGCDDGRFLIYAPTKKGSPETGALKKLSGKIGGTK